MTATDDDPMIVARYANVRQAEFAVSVLFGRGIGAFIDVPYTSSMFPHFALATRGVAVLVRAADVAEAKEVLANSQDAIAVRPATAADRQAILRCLRDAFEPFRSLYTAGGFADTVLSEETIADRMTSMTIFVATTDPEEIIGTIACSDDGRGEGHLRGMAVLPEWQGRGVAELLIEAAEEELTGRGCSRITLDTTRVLDRAMRFYESHGYRRSGKTGDFFGMELIEFEKGVGQ